MVTYTIREQDTIQVLAVKDLLDETNNRQLLQLLQQKMLGGFNKFIVDLSSLDFMNSVGLNFLISVHTKSQQSGGKMAVVNANAQVTKLFEVTKLSPLFQFSPSVEAALKDFSQN